MDFLSFFDFETNLQIALVAYIIDAIFGEFVSPHPVSIMGLGITLFEHKFYSNSIIKGGVLVIFLLLIVFGVSAFLEFFFLREFEFHTLGIFLMGIVASSTISTKMLFDSVKDVLNNPENIKYLVSRDTKNLSQNDISKASIETFAENLNDGVIAPLFYLIIFGFTGAMLYKAINTLDSMVGYRNERYERFGKISARLDDLVNFIPARITALLIAILSFELKSFSFFKYASGHTSPNAGHPISAMALALGVKLGGDTSYFGKVKKKPFFGDGREKITKEDVLKALSFRLKLDILIITSLGLIIFILKYLG